MQQLLDLKRVNSFLKVAQTGSFARAAELLGYSPAALSVQIQQLEKELGATLLDRVGKKVTLSGEGMEFYRYAKKILALNDAAFQCFLKREDQLTGSLRVGTVSSLSTHLFPQMIRQFHEAHPGVHVSVLTDTPSRLYAMLACNELDLVIVLDEPLADRKVVPLFRFPTRVVCCASRNHPLAGKQEISLDTLLSYPCILTEKGASYRRLAEQRLANADRFISPILESDSTGLIIDLLRSGREYSLLPLFLLADEILSGDLVILPVSGMDLSIEVQCFHERGKYVSREMQAFLTMAGQYVADTQREAENSGRDLPGSER